MRWWSFIMGWFGRKRADLAYDASETTAALDQQMEEARARLARAQQMAGTGLTRVQKVLDEDSEGSAERAASEEGDDGGS